MKVKRMIRRGKICAAGFALMAMSLVPASAGTDGFKMRSQSATGWLVEYTPDIRPVATLMLDSRPHLLFSGAASLDGGDATGSPLLPVDVLTLGVPAGSSLDVQIENPVYETVTDQLVAPHPMYELTPDRALVAGYIKDPRYYTQSRLFPSTQYIVDPPVRWRDQYSATIRLSPLQYNPAARTLRRLVKADLRITLRSASGTPSQVPPPTESVADPHFEKSLRDVILNYEQAKGWREREAGFLRSEPTDSTRMWFETGRTYYKIFIAEDGWYKVTKAQIAAAGGNPGSIDLATVKIFRRGVQIPLHIRPDTTIEFYAWKNYGDSTYIDFFTDTSTYWLTWGGGDVGRRFTPAFIDSVAGMPTVDAGRVSRHFEENNYYFQGTNTFDIINTETVAGEGWAWGTFDQWFFPNTTRNYNFDIDAIDSTGAQNAGIRIRLVSTTPNFATPNHHARFWVNDSLLGEITFAGRTSATFTGSVPHAWLRSGSNVLRIQSIQTQSSTNQFYLDWFQLDYDRRLRAVANQLVFNFSQLSGPTSLRYVAEGFTGTEAQAFDISSARMLTGASQGAGSLAFRDTVLSSQRLYVVVTPAGAKPVPPLVRHTFRDIRVNAQGADYIIITHRNFLAAAQQLAAHRQTRNNVRVHVVDVQDIYDEFNYGIMNALRLKTFLKHAYDTWPLPRPAYLTLFGDASWDYHKFFGPNVNNNYVPSYGVPSTDNWFVSFNPDTSSLPFMFVGRLPVSTPQEAQSTVQKLIGYDSYTLSDWNKEFLFITGGNTTSEQSQFNGYSEGMISQRIVPSPLGGNPSRVYKSTRGAIDGEHKARLKKLVKDGLVFMNFIGHSGGRIWGVDIGPPDELENTNGKLPFVSSVSCNVGGFSDPLTHVLAEDFLLADNRGAIGAWASSTLGYPDLGRDIVDNFLRGVVDTVRTLGVLTTNARVRLLRSFPSDFRINATVKTNNLIGDPLSTLAIPLKPDLAITQADISTSNPMPTVNDTVVQVKIKIKNYGLVAPDSVGVTVTDIFNGQTTFLANNRKLAATRYTDSLVVPWRGMEQVGVHTLSVTLDPENRINEVTKLNNVAARDQYVFANLLAVVRPISNSVVLPGGQRLVVTSPVGTDSSGFHYEFQLDTVDTFNSPALVVSGPVVPGDVTGEWVTPTLPGTRLYFWRARTVYTSTTGRWVEASFMTSNDVPSAPRVRWRENNKRQFAREILNQASATDSGVTIQPTPPVNLYVRSVGFRYNQLAEYYSVIQVNEQVFRGYWFEPGVGNSYIVMRLNDFTGAAEFRTFNTSAFPPDSGRREISRMISYINDTPVGNYLAFSVIFDGASNATESLYVAFENLGSTRIRQIQYGMSYGLIARRGASGPGMVALEQLTNDTAVVSLQVPNFFSLGSGSITSAGLTIPASWESGQWAWRGEPSTHARMAFLGVRPDGSTDTLRIYPPDSLNFNLAWLNPQTSGERYSHIRTAALLSTGNSLLTPALTDWSLEFIPPADLAVSARTIASTMPEMSRTIQITVHNIGFQVSDSSTVTLSVFDRANRARPLKNVSVPSVSAGGSVTVPVQISTSNLPRRATFQVAVSPAKRSKDLVAENNIAYFTMSIEQPASAANLLVYAGGTRVMDGDYLPATPRLIVRLPHEEGNEPALTQALLYVNGRLAETVSGRTGDVQFTPNLSDGNHILHFELGKVNVVGEIDTVEQFLSVNVSRESRILHLYNYPNPFSRETHFTFTLTGGEVPERVAIRIFTIAGRKIKEILVPGSVLQIGFNRISWDGRDEEGDEIANGYYLYQVSLSGEGKNDTQIQKLSKIR